MFPRRSLEPAQDRCHRWLDPARSKGNRHGDTDHLRARFGARVSGLHSALRSGGRQSEQWTLHPAPACEQHGTGAENCLLGRSVLHSARPSRGGPATGVVILPLPATYRAHWSFWFECAILGSLAVANPLFRRSLWTDIRLPSWPITPFSERWFFFFLEWLPCRWPPNATTHDT